MKGDAAPAGEPADLVLARVRAEWPGQAPSGAHLLRVGDTAIGSFELRRVAEDMVWLDSLDILTPHRRKGHAARFLQALREIADGARCRIGLEAFRRPDREDDGPLIRLYTACDFRPVSDPDEAGHVEMEHLPPSMGPDKEGLPPSWWRKTGRLEPSLAVLEECVDPELLADVGAGPPDIPEALRSWFSDMVDRLADSDRLNRIPLNPDLVEQGLHRIHAPLEILLCSRETMDHFLDAPGALGLHLVSSPEGDPFAEADPMSRVHRIAMVWDAEEFIHLIREEASRDVAPEHHFEEYVRSWLNTLFHEIEHVRLFAQNAALLSPSEVEDLSETGDFDHDVFDCSSGYGIRPLQDEDGATAWSDTIDEARRDMESHVEARGRRLMGEMLHGALTVDSFIAAAGVREDVQHIPGSSGAHDGSGSLIDDCPDGASDPEDRWPSP